MIDLCSVVGIDVSYGGKESTDMRQGLWPRGCAVIGLNPRRGSGGRWMGRKEGDSHMTV